MRFLLSQLVSYLSIETLAPQHCLTIGSFGQWAPWFQILDFCRKFKYLSVVAILGIDQVGACSAPPAWPLCKFPPDSFILFHLLGIMFTDNNTVRTYWEILCAVINVFSFAHRGGFYCVALHWHPYSGFLLSLQLCLLLNTFSFFPPPSDDLHEDLHLNGCGEHINNTYTNHVKAAQYLLLPDMNGGENSMNVL